MSTSLSLLRQQRSTVLKGISNSKEQIIILADKISRLRAASTNLQKSISELESNKRQVDSLSIENNRWSGTNETKFLNKYDAYRDSVKSFLGDTINAKEDIEDTIRRLEDSKAAYINGLNNLQSTLSSIEYKISHVKVE
ncbi:YwqH-like family protein [Virgibacillus proomii]|uniref:YwqH-like family protein n=1 Tax=Virgibacillus proomii TaxID=84407 RepID=UPI0009875E42|nr:DUF5082 family protein [Virgibacillus proomii]